MKLVSFDSTGKKGSHQVDDSLFAVPNNNKLLAQAIRVLINNSHQSTFGVQTRSDVSLTKRKLYRQKGTGGARHGAKSAPIFVGGGVAHGPAQVPSKNLKLSASQKNHALKLALSLQAEQTVVLADLENLGNKTNKVSQKLSQVVPESSVVLVLMSDTTNDKVRGFSNLPYVTVVDASQVNVLQISQAQTIVLSPEAIKVLEDRLLKNNDLKKKPSAVKASQAKSDEKQAAKTETKPTKSTKKPSTPKKNSSKKTAPKAKKSKKESK